MKNVSDDPNDTRSAILGRVDIAQDIQPEQSVVELKSAERLPNSVELQDTDVDQLPSIIVEPERDENPSHGTSGRRWVLLFIALILLGGIELVLFTVDLFEQQNWLGATWLLVLATGAALATRQVFREWNSLRRLKKQETDKQTAQNIYNSPAIGQGKSFCNQLAKGLPGERKNDVKDWLQGIQDHHNDREIISLFEQQVLVPADRQALSRITEHAGASSALIAVSPFALLDMAIVLWRNFKMLNEISRTYGVNLSYWGRVSLVRSVFKTMLYAGASEIIADAGNYALGAGLTGKLSSRVAQGLSAGVLTARIGVRAMQACRPVPWLSTQKPGLSGITSQLLSDLKKHIG